MSQRQSWPSETVITATRVMIERLIVQIGRARQTSVRRTDESVEGADLRRSVGRRTRGRLDGHFTDHCTGTTVHSHGTGAGIVALHVLQVRYRYQLQVVQYCAQRYLRA